MRLSILICTYNRASILEATLTSLMEQFIQPVADVEVIVVDNASTDDTATVVGSFNSVIYKQELQLGLSFARNRALHEARGEWIVFLDDDVILADGWLEAYMKFLSTAPDDCGFYGGCVRPHFETPPPKKLLEAIEYMQGVWGLCEAGTYDEAITQTTVALPVGANFGGRRDAFRQVGFDPKYGRNGAKLLSFEETLLIESLIREGWKGYWVKDAEIAHRVPDTRYKLAYISRFYVGLGRSHWAHRKDYSRWQLFLKVSKRVLRKRHSTSLEDPSFNLRYFSRHYYYLGAFKEAYGLS